MTTDTAAPDAHRPLPLISLVVAMTRERVIGRDNGLPWHLPADLKHFKSVTWGKPILMGRRTYDSIGKPLPGRVNLVLTRHSGWSRDGVIVVHSVEEAMDRAREAAVEGIGATSGGGELACIGGAEVFKLLLPLTQRIHLTRIDADIPGDTVFPPLDPDQWREIEQRRLPADERNAYDLTFITLERVPAGAR